MTGVQQTGDRQMRTPMQWSAEQHAGFTTGWPWFPLNADYATGRNVAEQSGDPTSLLSYYRELIRLRNEHTALRVGQPILLETGHPAVYALLRVDAAETLLVVINLGSEPVDDYALNVAAGPLTGSYQLLPLLAPREGATLQATAQGGVVAYRPLGELPPQQAMIWQLQP
jgi:glycosidase